MARATLLGAILILVSSLLIHLIIFHGNPQIFNTIEFQQVFFIISLVTIGTAYLLYPLLGWIGDNYHTTKYWILLAGVFILILSLVASLGLGVLNYKLTNNIQGSKEFPLMIVPIILVLMLGIGLFESNALQFGVDQIANQSTKRVLTYIKWYFWTHHCGHLIMFYTLVIFIEQRVFKPRENNNQKMDQNGGGILFVSSAVLLIASIIVLCTMGWCSRAIDTSVKHKQSTFSLTTILQIVKFIIKTHIQRTQPLESHKSLFDACIERHGGPFSIEAVEKAKHSLHVVAILTTCSALHLSGDTYSLMEQLVGLTNKCPSLQVILVLGINPSHLSYLTVLLVVPLEIIFTGILNFKEIGMLKRIFVGLLLALMGLCTQMIINIGALTNMTHNTMEKTQLTSSCLQLTLNDTDTIQGLEIVTTEQVRYLFYSIVIPQILNGLAHWLVCMTVLQFLCAQAPREIQGLLIGGWYATFAIRFLIIGFLDAFIKSHTWWFCYKGVSIITMTVLTFSYVCFAYGYRYRERDDELIQSLEETSVTIRVLPVTNNRNRNYKTFR